MISKEINEIDSLVQTYKTNYDLNVIKHINVPYSNRLVILRSIEKELRNIQKAWQLKSGKWHDYDSNGKIIEVSAPGQKEKKIEEKPENEIEKPEEIKENSIEKLLKENEDLKGLENLKNEVNKYDNVNDFIENNKPIYGKRSTQYWNGKVYGWRGMDSIIAMRSAEINWQHRNQKVFYRTTNNKDEYRVENLKSKNHLTGEEYEGMSVWYNQSYFSEGGEVQPHKKPKYIGVVTGDISSFGDDGEPILQNVKWIQKPIEKLPKKYEDLEIVDYDTPAPWTKLDIGLFGKDVIRDYAPSKDQLAEFYNKYKNKDKTEKSITKSNTVNNFYKTLNNNQIKIVGSKKLKND